MAASILTDTIRHHTRRLAESWRDLVRQSPQMATYQKFSDEELVRRNEQVFVHLARWLTSGASRSEVGQYFVEVAKARYHEHFPLCEVIYALNLDKRVLWSFVELEGLLDSAMRLHQALETLHSIQAYFDSGYFYLVRGYMEELYTTLGHSGKLNEKELRQYFFPGSFFHTELVYP